MHAFRSILIALTKQHTPNHELQQAFRLALNNRATLVIAVFDRSLEDLQKLQFLPLEAKLEKRLRAQLEEELERVKAIAWEQGIKATAIIVPERQRVAIQKIIAEHRIDLVIKPADRNGVLSRHSLGGDDSALLRKCPKPILIMKDHTPQTDTQGRLMVAVDVGDPDAQSLALNRQLLQYSAYLATQEYAQLHLVSVWDIPLSKKVLQTLSEEELYELEEATLHRYQTKMKELIQSVKLDDMGINTKVHILKGCPSDEIKQAVKSINVDLIVMGSLSRQKKGFLIGSTAENLINNVDCSILAIKPEGAEYLI